MAPVALTLATFDKKLARLNQMTLLPSCQSTQ